MKKIYTLIALTIFSLGAFAQVPQKMSYQAVIRNASGNLVVSSLISMEIVIINEDIPSPVYAETHIATTNANGLVSVQLGAGAAFFGSFSSINWSTGNFSVQVDTDVTGGTNYDISGTSQLLSVPYAMYAGSAGGGLGDGSAAGIMPYWNGTTWITNNTNLYNNGTNIGLSTTTPTAQLELADIYTSGGKNLQIGDDTYLSDIDVNNTLGIYGVQNPDRAGIKLGSTGATIWGQNDNIGIGNNNPTAKLDVAGNIKIVDGSQGTGKILTSDANGLATWSTPTAAPASAPYYHFTTPVGGNMNIPVGNSGAVMTVALKDTCGTNNTAVGMIYYDINTNTITVLNSSPIATAYIEAAANVVTLYTGCTAKTFTFTNTGGVATITVGGVANITVESKWMVLGI